MKISHSINQFNIEPDICVWLLKSQLGSYLSKITNINPKKKVKWLKILMPHIEEITPYPLFVTTKMNKIITRILTKLKHQKKTPNKYANPFNGCNLEKSLAPN